MKKCCKCTGANLGAKTALLLIACGERYWGYASQFIASAKKFFVPHDVILFTDCRGGFDAALQIPCPSLGFPNATLKRYHLFTEQRQILSQYDYLFYSDVDMRFVAPVAEEEVFSDGITATLHPGYVGLSGTPETRPCSTACVSGPLRHYFCGGFNGGRASEFLRLAVNIRAAVDADERSGVMAVWHDESHLNRYLLAHPPAKILSPAFCYPDVQGDYYRNKWRAAGLGEVQPKLLALEK